MSFNQWKFSWIRHNFIVPSHVALAHLTENGVLKVIVRFRGTSQRSSYTICRFQQGVRREEAKRYPSLEAAMAAA